jgi:O-antigen/teichoic acid export membrane protein
LSELKRKVSKGILWSTIERFSAKGMQFVLGLVLARLLLPSDYGLVGMLAIFLAISQTFIDSGFGTALIQKKNRDELDFSTTFYFNIVVSAFFYVLLYLLAPLIASFYKEPILVDLTRVIGLSIIISSLAVVQRTKYTINLDFKTQTKASLTSVVVGGTVGIYLAYTGFGVWALVWQNLLRRIIEVLILWMYSKWLPRKGFSWERFKALFSFGSKLLASGLLNTIFDNLYLIIIGKLFSAKSLGYYTRAQQFAAFPSSNVTGIIQRVTFPILSEMQDDNVRLIDTYRKMIKLTALLIFPLMMGLAALADPLVRIILTDKWAETIWMLQLLSFSMMWFPIHAMNLNVLNVKGRSDLFLKLEIIKKILIAVILVISVPFGIKAIIIGQIASSYFALIINTFYTKRLINYGFIDQMVDLLKVLLLSFAMGALIYYSITFIELNIFKLILGTLLGSIFFLSVAWLLDIGEIRLLPDFIRQRK